MPNGVGLSGICEDRRTFVRLLRADPLGKFPLIVKSIGRQRTRIAKKIELSHDALWHTLISTHVANWHERLLF